MLRNLLAHPLTRNLDLDDPKATEVHRELILKKSFLKRLYDEWYALIEDSIPKDGGPILELGSGAGFIKDKIPALITSDVFEIPDLDVVLDGQILPFSDSGLGAIIMIDVLHHLPRVGQFFKDAGRCLRKDGRIIMIEPWTTPWSRFVYRNFHHEPFCPEEPEWGFSSNGPMSGANGALPWIIFQRDRLQFEAEFPQWEIQAINPMMPFAYLISGGVSMRGFAPGWSYRIVRSIEKYIETRMDNLAMFALIVLRKRSN